MFQLGHPPPLRESKTPTQEQLPPTEPPGGMPPLPPSVTPLSRTRTRKQKDQDTLDPIFPTQVNATSADTALTQGEHRGLYPTMLQLITGLLRTGTGEAYLANDEGLFWYAPPGSILLLAIPRFLASGILALVHTTYGPPGVARTTELVQSDYNRISLKSEVREYVLSYGCRRILRSTSQRVAILPARFLKLWEVLEIDIHDMRARSGVGNKNLLVEVDRVSKFLFADPLYT